MLISHYKLFIFFLIFCFVEKIDNFVNNLGLAPSSLFLGDRDSKF
jgi:hypothetical protein